MQAFEEGRAMIHEGVAAAAEVCAISHFFGEDIGGAAFTADMSDGNSTLFDPVKHNILLELNMKIAF
jgi:hypothetical protein